MPRSSVLLICAAAALTGCGSQVENQAQAPVNDAADAARSAIKAQPVKEEHRSLQLTPQWLAGRWQTDDGDCSAGDTFFNFNPDGTYTYLTEEGRWSLERNALTIEITTAGPDGGSAGDKTTAQVTPVSPNEAEIRLGEGQPPSRMLRCHEG